MKKKSNKKQIVTVTICSIYIFGTVTIEIYVKFLNGRFFLLLKKFIRTYIIQ